MQSPNANRRITEIDGVVRRIDPISREGEFHTEGVTIRLDIPINCVITLRGERIKLRLIQPRDRVRVSYNEHRGIRAADAIDVLPGGPAPP
jgi:hypothetical protein